jgi:hypothetical protein
MFIAYMPLFIYDKISYRKFMSMKDKCREACIHFELYRLLKNNMSRQYSNSIRYESLEPECPAGGKSVDLVIEAKKGQNVINLAVIEVKKPTMGSYLLSDPRSRKQVADYAEKLKSQFSILTDGEVLRLFKDNQPVGDYSFELDDENVRDILRELLELYEGTKESLSLPEAFLRREEDIAKDRDGLVNALKEVLKQLEIEEEFKLRCRDTGTNRIRYLTIGTAKDVFSMAIQLKKVDISKDQSYLYLQLTGLRAKLGVETLHELLVKLAQIPGFIWVDPNDANRTKEFTWRKLKDMPFERRDPEFNLMKKQLVEWFREISNRLAVVQN